MAIFQVFERVSTSLWRLVEDGVEAEDSDGAKKAAALKTKRAGIFQPVPPTSYGPEMVELELNPRAKAREVTGDDLKKLPSDEELLAQADDEKAGPGEPGTAYDPSE